MVRNFHAKTYKYKLEYVKKENLPTTKQYGFIAQDVEKMYPEFVITDANGLKYKVIDYGVPEFDTILDLYHKGKLKFNKTSELKFLKYGKK